MPLKEQPPVNLFHRLCVFFKAYEIFWLHCDEITIIVAISRLFFSRQRFHQLFILSEHSSEKYFLINQKLYVWGTNITEPI